MPQDTTAQHIPIWLLLRTITCLPASALAAEVDALAELVRRHRG
jgi:hypothetical protein